MLYPEDIARLHGEVVPESTAAAGAAVDSHEPPVSTADVFWKQRWPQLCEAVGRVWSRGRMGLEMSGGLHSVLERWSMRATDSVWNECVAALLRSPKEPSNVASYLCGILRRSVPAAEKARKGDGPTIHDLQQPPQQPKAPVRVGGLARHLAMCNKPVTDGQGAPSAAAARGRHHGDHDHGHGGDRDDRRPQRSQDLALGAHRKRA